MNNILDGTPIPYASITGLEHQPVSAGIGDVYKQWSHRTAVMISSQTGSGKNTFILKHLLPYAKDTNRQVFIFSNRIALNIQQKKLLMQQMSIPDIYTDEELRQQKTFGSVTILNYHEALNYLNYLGFAYTIGYNVPSSGYAIFDEAHFFLNDATYNAYTENILTQLIHIFSLFTRIYMTATPNEVAPIISSLEYNNPDRLHTSFNDMSRIFHHSQNEQKLICDPDIALQIYHFKRDYSKYNIKFFTDETAIQEEIKSAGPKNKWLYFMNSTARQNKLKQDLSKELSNKITLFDSRKIDSSKDWEKICNGEIPKHVLVTTSVLDNGINITDPHLHNIVIECETPNNLIQMLGRKRLQGNESVNVYIQVPTEDFLTKRIRDIEKMRNFIRNYRMYPATFLQYNWQGFETKFRNLFYINANQQLVLNNFAETALINQHQFYSKILSDMQKASKIYSPDALTVYPQMVLKQLGLPTQIKWLDNSDLNQAKENIIRLFDDHLASDVPEEQRANFYQTFRENAKIICDHNGQNISDELPDDKRSAKTYISRFMEKNKKFFGCTYTIKSNQDKDWTISKSK